MSEEVCVLCGDLRDNHQLDDWDNERCPPHTTYFTRSRTITKEQVEDAAREMAKGARVPEDIGWRVYHGHALAAAKAFGLTVEG